MPSFTRRPQAQRRTQARGIYTIRKGIGYLQANDFDSALTEFRKVIASKHPDTTRLVKSVASFYVYRTEVFRKEFKKVRYANANPIDLTATPNTRSAWSDVDIAAVLVTPDNRAMNFFLSAFLGRSPEAIRFQRRYAFSKPLRSWVTESGEHYTRFTQTRQVAARLGLV